MSTGRPGICRGRLEEENSMTRIVCLAAGAALSLAVAPGQPPQEQSGGKHEQHEHFMQCAKACDDCARICNACATHCAHLVADAKKEHLHTLQTCQDCATACKAASEVAARMGPFAGILCSACAEACKGCGDACAKIADDSMMKQCADECKRCEQACRAMVSHASRLGN